MTQKLTQKQGEPISSVSDRELITAVSAKGIGKTTFLSQFVRPSRIDKDMIYIDGENSANRVRKGLLEQETDYALYINTMEKFGNLPGDDDLLDKIKSKGVPWVSTTEQDTLIDYFFYFIGEISKIPRNKYKVMAIDTGEQLEASMQAYVTKNKSKFGVTNDWTLWTMGIYPLYKYVLQGIWGRGIDTILLSFHIKDAAEGWGKTRHKIQGKVVPGGKPMLKFISTFMVWLVPDPHNPKGEPAGLVLKERLGHYGIDRARDEWDTRTMIPKRIPICTWEEIRRYMKDGYNIVNPKLTEVPSTAEMGMMSEMLNDTQTRMMMLELETEQQQNAIIMSEMGLLPTAMTPVEAEVVKTVTVSNDPPQTKSEAIARWKSLGKPIPELLKTLRLKEILDNDIAERWNEILE